MKCEGKKVIFHLIFTLKMIQGIDFYFLNTNYFFPDTTSIFFSMANCIFSILPRETWGRGSVLRQTEEQQLNLSGFYFFFV